MARQMPNNKRKGRVTPDPDSEGDFLREGKKRTGTYTATETGATSLAEKRNVFDAAMTRSDKKTIKKGILR